MDDQYKKLKKMTKFMRENGVSSVEIDGIKIVLSSAAMFPVEQVANKEELPTAEIPPLKQFTDEEILLWSSPGVSLSEDANA